MGIKLTRFYRKAMDLLPSVVKPKQAKFKRVLSTKPLPLPPSYEAESFTGAKLKGTLPTVSKFSASVNGNLISAKWSASKNVAGYRLVLNGPTSTTMKVTTTTATFPPVLPGRYTLSIQTYDSKGIYGTLKAVTVEVKETYAQPLPITSLTGKVSSGTIVLSWAYDGTQTNTTTLVYRSTTTNYVQITELDYASTSYTDKNVVAGTQYFYRLARKNKTSAALSQFSATISVALTNPVPTPTPTPTNTLQIVDAPNPTDRTTYTAGGTFFGPSGTYKNEDINQFDDGIANCYEEAGVGGIAYSRLNDLFRICPTPMSGKVTCNYYGKGKAVRTDATLPPPLVTNRGQWFRYLVKTYAWLRTGANTYASLGWGSSSAALRDIGYPATASTVTSFPTSSLVSLVTAKAVIVANSFGTQAAGSPIVASHCYTYLFPKQNADGSWSHVLRNPWSVDGATVIDSNANDGIITLTDAQFKTCFNSVSYTTGPLPG